MKRKIILVLIVVLFALGFRAYFDYRAYQSRTNAAAVWGWIVTLLFEASVDDPDILTRVESLDRLEGEGAQPVFLKGDLPARNGERPRMVRGVPHRQIDQHPSLEMRAYMEERLALFEILPDSTLPVRFAPSLWELTGARALLLEGCDQASCHQYVLRSKGEFAHLHSHGGSYHMILSLPDIRAVIESGWGELFPVAGWLGGYVPNIVLVYAPRDEAEAAVFQRILRASYDFARTGI